MGVLTNTHAHDLADTQQGEFSNVVSARHKSIRNTFCMRSRKSSMQTAILRLVVKELMEGLPFWLQDPRRRQRIVPTLFIKHHGRLLLKWPSALSSRGYLRQLYIILRFQTRAAEKSFAGHQFRRNVRYRILTIRSHRRSTGIFIGTGAANSSSKSRTPRGKSCWKHYPVLNVPGARM